MNNSLKKIAQSGFTIKIEPDWECLSRWYWDFQHVDRRNPTLSLEAEDGVIITHIDVDFSGMKNRQKIQDLFAPLFRKVGEIEIDQFLDSVAGILKQIEW